MEIFKKQIKAFHYEELSQDAKETAKNWFLSDETRYVFRVPKGTISREVALK